MFVGTAKIQAAHVVQNGAIERADGHIFDVITMNVGLRTGEKDFHRKRWVLNKLQRCVLKRSISGFGNV